MRTMATVLTALAIANPALASENLAGTWSTKDGCERLNMMSTDPEAAWKGNFEDISYLSPDGIRGYEWGCEFLDAKEDSDGNRVIVSSCSMEGDSWPELIMVQGNGNGWSVVVRGKDGEIASTDYPVRCR